MTAIQAVVVALIASALASPAIEFARPEGRFSVGTTTWHVTDESRRETFTDGRSAREVEVLAWYPIASGGRGTVAPYLRDGLAEVRGFASLLKSEHAFDGLADVITHAAVDAEPLSTAGPLPVVLFSHGYTAAPSAYTALAEDMASHGYAVLSVVHPYEATAATLTDGRVVTMLDETGAFLKPISDVFAEWSDEDRTMASVTASHDRNEQLTLLRGYLSGTPKTQQALARWVADERVVLDRLGALSRTTVAGRLAARLDLSRLGVFGHSMGGVVAAEFCRVDRRCKAGLNLDGSPQHGALIDGTLPVPFLMAYTARPGRAGGNDPIYRRATKTYIRVDVAGTTHLDFSDMTFWGGPLRERAILGEIAPDRAIALQRRITREFFDKMLLGKPAAILDGTLRLPEVTVIR